MDIELLAPAGSPEGLTAAARSGADAVYLGLDRFSARSGAVNFNEAQFAEAAEYCRLRGIKIYVALNTLIFDGELSDFFNTAKKAALYGADAFIIQDLGAAMFVKEAVPEMRIHASTQMSVHTRDGVKAAMEMGFSRVTAARELSLSQIAALSDPEGTAGWPEIEVFVHGAHCMSVSGQCYMSAVIGGRSANRGMCAQPCRLPFSADKGGYALSLKDMSLIEHIGELKKAGVASLKIEGRMKRPEYAAAAVYAFRAALDGKTPDTDMLRAVFSRSGFTDGYLTGKHNGAMFGIREKEDVLAAKSVLPRIRGLYAREKGCIGADMRLSLKRGEKAVLTMRAEGAEVGAGGEIPLESDNPPDIEFIKKHLSRLGDTPYYLNNFTLEAAGGEKLFIPASQLNHMRRECSEKLDSKRLGLKKPSYEFKIPDLNFTSNARRSGAAYEVKTHKKDIYIRLESAGQIPSDGLDGISFIELPVRECLKAAGTLRGENAPVISAALNRFIPDETALKLQLYKLRENGIKHAVCGNISHIKTAGDLGFILHGDYGLNAANSLSLKALENMGLKDAVLSFELTFNQIKNISSGIKTGVLTYGRAPLMLCAVCPVGASLGAKCEKDCPRALTDKTGRKFPVICNADYIEILNCDILSVSDMTDNINADFIKLKFTDETPRAVSDIINSFKNKTKTTLTNRTKGLYIRGLKYPMKPL